MPISGIEDAEAYKLFLLAKKKLNKTNEALYLPEQEYFLIQKGISKGILYNPHQFDSLTSVITTYLKIRYLIKVDVSSSKKGGTFRSYTALELDQYNRHYYQNKESNTGRLVFSVYDVEREISESKFEVFTQINPLIIKTNDGSESRVNLTTESSAVIKAFEKGIQKIKKGIIRGEQNLTIAKNP